MPYPLSAAEIIYRFPCSPRRPWQDHSHHWDHQHIAFLLDIGVRQCRRRSAVLYCIRPDAQQKPRLRPPCRRCCRSCRRSRRQVCTLLCRPAVSGGRYRSHLLCRSLPPEGIRSSNLPGRTDPVFLRIWKDQKGRTGSVCGIRPVQGLRSIRAEL